MTAGHYRRAPVPGTVTGMQRITTRTSIVGRLAVAGALAATALGLAAPAATAEEDEKIDVKGGYGLFENDQADIGREHLWVGDERRDGLSVRAYLDWRDKDGRHTLYTTASGKGEHDHADVYLREGTPVTLSVCYLDEGHVKRCSLGQRGRA
jgi:hypothetical protein